MKQQGHDFVDILIERANAAKGLPADYLSCVAGMWADTFHITTVSPKLIGENRQAWFVVGMAASKRARSLKI